MLPNQVNDLLNQSVAAFDSEHSPEVKIAIINKQILWENHVKGLSFGSGTIMKLAVAMSSYLDERTVYTWTKLQEIVTVIAVEFYSNLAEDLKAEITKHHNPAMRAAEKAMDKLQREKHVSPPYTVKARRKFHVVIPKIFSEVDLFCVKYRTIQAKQPNISVVINEAHIKEFKGVLGNSTNSQVNIG